MNLLTSLLLNRLSGLSIFSLAVNFLNAMIFETFQGSVKSRFRDSCLFSTGRRSILR
jgi:hypothetical protein